MSDIQNMILREIADDISIHAHDIALDIKAKGFPRRRKYITIHGSVQSEHEIKKVTQIAEHHAGDNYTVINELHVKET
jgi:hypothetical protein